MPRIRTRKQVIEAMIKAARDTDYMGISVEPISSLADPEDIIEGDYKGMVMYESELEKGKLFGAPFVWTFEMDTLREQPNDRFKRNMNTLRKQMHQFETAPVPPTRESMVIHASGISSMTEFAQGVERRKKAH